MDAARGTATPLSARRFSSVEHRYTVTSVSDVSALVLVEGVSDKVALETLAARRGRDLDADGVAVLAIGGAQALARTLEGIRAQQPNARLAGLYDLGEEQDVRRALERTGFGSNLTRASLEALGFYVCEPDLEGELIGALGTAGVEAVLERGGSLASFRTFQRQPQWRGQPAGAQLRRFFGSSAGKIKYARLLVEALELTRVPRPLDAVLARV
jgi:OLD-like protein